MKKTALYILLTGCMLFLCACSVQKEDKEKLRDIDFTVVDSYDAPEELQKKIDEKKEKTFEISYADNGYLYIARGYGSQDTSGYSVEVKECFEAKDGIYLKTNLLGPPKTEEIIEGKTYPYVIVKMEYSDKNVVFD
ncbi:MAG: protease complex subunit PrcB family protein [Dorea sp.]|nr:protease complex subunit PrcB family protein [Dorea sp.]